MAAPTIPTGGVGTISSAMGSITPVLPSVSGGFLDGDVIVGIGETIGGQSFPTAASNGFAHVTGSPVVSGTATALHVVWRRWTAGLTAHAWGDSGDHNVGGYVVIRGLKTTGNPWNQVAVATEAAANTSAEWPTPQSTTTADCMVLLCIATGRDLTSTANLGAVTASGLSGITERVDTWVSLGGGGGVGMASAVKAGSGAWSGTMTATMGSTDAKALMTLALEPVAVGGVTATPAVVAATVAVARPLVGVRAAPVAVAATATTPASTRQIGAAPVSVAAVATLPAATRTIAAGPAVVARAVVLPQAAAGGGTAATRTPAVIIAAATLPQAAVAVIVGPAVTSTVATLPQATATGGGPAPVAVLSSTIRMG